MIARESPPNDYGQLAARFGAVRRGWRRAAVLSGLAIAVTESIGIVTALLFLDWLYEPLPALRLGALAIALAGIGYLFVRHVLKPLVRKIPDEQIALYIEEHRTELDGVLITAVEYGRQRDQRGGNQAAFIDAVVHEAAVRSGRLQVGRVVDFSRWKKYGIGALACFGLYVLLGTLFPNTFGRHLGRILQPWHATREDLARHAVAEEVAAPLRFTLSKRDTRLPRGTSFGFEVTLSKSKPAGAPVELFLRPATSGSAWQHLALKEIEKLNGFQGAIPDVNEDLDFYVSCGGDKSDTYRLTVYDPLVVHSLEMTIHYPDYLKRPDEIEHPFTGDLTAVVGSTATLRMLASTPLKDGQIKWSDGKTQGTEVDPKLNTAAVVSFEVKEDATYDYRLTDVNGQQAASAAPLSVHAVPDLPPTIEVKSPQSPVLTQPLGEIDFQVQAGDDFGVAGIDLVYALLDDQGNAHETRVPLTLVASSEKGMPQVVEASYRLMLEDANPPFKPSDAISYHLEARDARGQTTDSETGFILVGYFEHWATWAAAEAAGVHDDTAPDLMALLNLTWQLDSKKAQLPAADFQKQSQDIADKIENPEGQLFDFIDLHHFPQLARIVGIVNPHLKRAHDALATAETPAALKELSAAVALTAGAKLKENSVTHLSDPQMMVGSHFSPPALTMLEQARLNTLAAAAKDKTHAEGDQAQAEKAAEMAKKVEELLKKQDALVAQAQRQSAAPGQPEARSPALAPAPAAGGGAAPADADKPDLATAQHGLAEQTRAAGDEAKGGATGTVTNTKLREAANKTNEASRLMEEAARDFAAGKNSEGQTKARLAKTALQGAGETLHDTDRDRLEAAISDTARHAAVLLEKQQELSTQTGTLAKDLGDQKPDQRQQRDLQARAYQQTVLEANADALGDEIAQVNQLAARADQPEAARALTEVQRVVKRTPAQAKMSDAVIDLNNADPGSAAEEQKKAETSLAKIIEGLQAGSDAMAGNREAQLSRAGRAAKDARNSAAALLAKQEAQGKGNTPRTADQAQGETQKSGDQVSPEAPGNGSGGGDDVRKLAYNLTQLVAVIDYRQLVPQDEVERLKEMSQDKSELEKRLAVDPEFLRGASNLVAGISDKIEAEMAAKAAAGKLFSSQREECPPNYRQFVNKYFEALSLVAPPPPEGGPRPAGQP